MPELRISRSAAVRALPLFIVLCTGWALAQTGPSRRSSTTPVPVTGPSAVTDERTRSETHQQLLKLLRTTPALTRVVTLDPSLLSDQSYVARTNPALAEFLALHPEVARNPEFYLFKGTGNGQVDDLPSEGLPEMAPDRRDSALGKPWRFIPVLVLAAGLFWLVRLFVDNLRWRRTLKVQAELQNRLLDKFTTNQELIAYLDTEPGKRILQLAAMSPSNEAAPQTGGMLVRIMTPLQSGAVLIPIGIGLWYLSETVPNQGGIRIVAIVALTLGIGLVAAAAVCWRIARRYGLLPHAAVSAADGQQEQR